MERPVLDTTPFARYGMAKLDMPLPSSDAELQVLSHIYFGLPLKAKFSVLGKSGRYEIEQLYNSYHGEGFAYGKCCIIGYDHSRIFWGTVFGPLICGGIASRSYGQFHVRSHRHRRRLERWLKRVRNGQGDHLSRPFARLAQAYGLGENIGIRGTGVLTGGRVDAAPSSFTALPTSEVAS